MSDQRKPDRLGLVLLALVGIAASLLNLTIVVSMAKVAGFPAWISPGYWFILDAYAITSLRAALISSSEKVRHWAGFSTVFSLLVSALAAGCHVFVRNGHLPDGLTFAILCLPVVMLGLSGHLVLLSRLESREADSAPETHRVMADIIEPERPELEVTETVTHQRQVTRRSGTKTSDLRAALEQMSRNDRRKNTEIATDLASKHGVSRPTASKEVAAWRPMRGQS